MTRRLGERSDHARDVRAGSTEGGEALENELLERGRDRQLLTGLDAASPLHRARELKREERVPARGLTDP